MRLLVTGSRTWTDVERLERILDEAATGWAERNADPYIKEGLTLVSGHCRDGADRLAEQWFAKTFPLEEIERHPADWKKHGKRAGFERNMDMVDTKPDLCVAFIDPCAKVGCPYIGKHGSHGATHCANYAEEAHVPVLRIWGWAR